MNTYLVISAACSGAASICYMLEEEVFLEGIGFGVVLFLILAAVGFSCLGFINYFWGI